MEYADNVGKVTSDYRALQKFKQTVPIELEKRDLIINQDKTEQFTIITRNNNEWKKCKYLGSMLDTSEDIKRRKGISISAANKLRTLFCHKKLTTQTKMSAFTTYIEPIFLYNCELWSLTTCQAENTIDAFQRRLLRTFVLNVSWPDIVKNVEVYQKTNAIKWSNRIKTRRLKWLGTVLRANGSTPMKKALEYANTKYQRPRGKPTTTWLSVVKNDLKTLNIEWVDAIEIAKNSKDWNIIINR